jgi:translation initiation factor IF-2
MMRLSQVARKLNIGKNTIIEFLDSKGYKIEDNPNFKIGGEQLDLLSREFADSALDK